MYRRAKDLVVGERVRISGTDETITIINISVGNKEVNIVGRSEDGCIVTKNHNEITKNM